MGKVNTVSAKTTRLSLEAFNQESNRNLSKKWAAMATTAVQTGGLLGSDRGGA